MAPAAGNVELSERLARARAQVALGSRLGKALEEERVLTGGALQLVHLGEASGELARMIRRAGELALEEAERRLKGALTLLEPALVLAFGAVVAVLAGILLQTMYSLRPAGM